MKRVLGHPTARPGTTDCASGVRAEPRNWYAAVSGSWYCFVPALVVSVRGTHDGTFVVFSPPPLILSPSFVFDYKQRTRSTF